MAQEYVATVDAYFGGAMVYQVVDGALHASWNPLAAMCHHKDTHSHEWTEPAPSKALDAPAGIAAISPMGRKLGLGC